MTHDIAYRTAPTDVHATLGKWMLVDGLPIVYDPAASRGYTVVDSRTGDEYLDLFSFFASMPVGHNHPGLADEGFRARLLAAALVKPSNSDIYTQPMADFVAAFGRTLPAEFVHTFFIEGGALAVENALKVAFDWKVRKNIAAGRCPDTNEPTLGTKILHFEGAFHGRSGYTLSLTNGTSPAKTKYFPKFDWPRVSTPGCHFPVDLARVEAAEAASVAEIEAVFGAHPHDVAAIIVETILGEGGDIHLRPAFLAKLRQLCDTHEALLIFDEVQAGMGLTGNWWAFSGLGVTPDIFAFGKKSQVCGIAATARVDEVESCFKVSSRINSTWGGNLADMVRCTRYIEIIEQEDLVGNAARVGEIFGERLAHLADRYTVISNVRGRGLMRAFDLPDPATRDSLARALTRHKVLGLTAGSRSLRFRPVLDFDEAGVDLSIDRLRAALGEL
jgi:L-lysine 6-transaminase